MENEDWGTAAVGPGGTKDRCTHLPTETGQSPGFCVASEGGCHDTGRRPEKSLDGLVHGDWPVGVFSGEAHVSRDSGSLFLSDSNFRRGLRRERLAGGRGLVELSLVVPAVAPPQKGSGPVRV
jgi:hypothetical protein